MMALPRSATKALKLWPWKDIEGAPGMREHKQRNGSMASFGPPTGVTEEYKLGKSEVAENEVNIPVLRTPSKLVKKRDGSTNGSRNGSRKDLATPSAVAPIAEPIAQAPDVPSRPDTPSSTDVSASVDSDTAEHVIVPPHPPATPTPKHNVLVKKNSLKRAAAKPVLPEEPVPESGTAELSTDAAVPEPAVEPRDFAVTAEPDVPNQDESSDEEGTDDGASIHATAPTTLEVEPEAPVYAHPFPVRGTTPPSGTRFIEGADGSLEPTESRTTGTTAPPARPGRPTRRISLRSFGFFYGKDSRPTSASFFPAYVPPTDHVVYEVGDESEPELEVEHTQRPIATHKRNNSRLSLSLLGQRKVSAPKVPKVDKRAVDSALTLRTLIIGPAALDVKDRDKGSKGSDPKASSAAALRKVNHQLLVPSEANRVIAALRELPPPDLPPATAETVETVRRKKGWVFGRGHAKGDRGKEKEKTKEGEGTVAMPIHGCCLDLTDEEAEQKHFSKLTGSGVGAQSSAGAQANANIGSADLSSLIPMLKNMRLVNLQASPDVSSMNAASLGAQLSAPDLGFGQPADKDGLLAGSVPSPGSLVDGMEKVGQTLMSLGFATTAAVLPSHVGVHPPKDRMSVLTYWWGYEVVFPPPTMRYLGHVKSISGALLNFLTAFALFSNGVREMLPFIRYIAQFIDFEWAAIKAQDKGRGVVCAATWVMPAALVPRPWDFVDPPIAVKPGQSMTPGPATREFSSQAAAAVASPEPLASGPGGTEAIAEMDGVKDAGAFSAEVRDGEADDARGDENDELEDQRENDRGTLAEVATTPIAESPATAPRHEVAPDTKVN